MSYKLQILSLGAGVQSTALYLMSCEGVLPKLHAAIFADTGWESLATYHHLEWLESLAPVYGIPIIRVMEKDGIRNSLLNGARSCGNASPPYYILLADGSVGRGRRQCTREYKLAPILKEVRALLGLRPRQRAPQGAVDQWVGISTDEAQRAKVCRPSRLQTIKFPLIQPLMMSRWDCIQWINSHFPGHVPPKSSCIGCPFHSMAEWRNLSEPEWLDACHVDEQIRKLCGIKGEIYMHRSCRPLHEIDRNDYQMRLFNNINGADDRQVIMLAGLSEI